MIRTELSSTQTQLKLFLTHSKLFSKIILNTIIVFVIVSSNAQSTLDLEIVIDVYLR